MPSTLGDVLALVEDLQRLAVVARAVADVAGHVDVGQEVHLDLEHAVALAGLAAPAGHVEREAPGAVAALAGGRHFGEEFADRREQAGVGGRVAARRAADRALVDVDDLVERVQAFDRVVRRRLGVALVELACATAAYSVSLTSVLLPEPETPVTQVNRPTGISTLMLLQVVAARARDASACCGAGLSASAARALRARRCAARRRGSVRSATRRSPPPRPACPGRSRGRRARRRPGPCRRHGRRLRIMSSSCSTTSTLLPRSRRRRSVAIRRSLSRWCRPMLGSSSTYITPVRPEPICEARRMRWASPPDSVSALRSRLR